MQMYFLCVRICCFMFPLRTRIALILGIQWQWHMNKITCKNDRIWANLCLLSLVTRIIPCNFRQVGYIKLSVWKITLFISPFTKLVGNATKCENPFTHSFDDVWYQCIASKLFWTFFSMEECTSLCWRYIQIKPVCDMYLSKQFTMVSMNMMSLKMVFTPLQDTSEYISFQTLKY